MYPKNMSHGLEVEPIEVNISRKNYMSDENGLANGIDNTLFFSPASLHTFDIVFHRHVRDEREWIQFRSCSGL